MEDLDLMYGKEDLGDVVGVEDFLDFQLLVVFKGVGFREGDLIVLSGYKGLINVLLLNDVGLSLRGMVVVFLKLVGGVFEVEKKQLEEQIWVEKL